jgi:hypothetical protein
MVPRQPFNEMKPNSGRDRAKAGGSGGKNANRQGVCQRCCAFNGLDAHFSQPAGEQIEQK